MTGLISNLSRRWLERGRRKRFTGNLFDRSRGLEPVLEDCRGETILDIGSCDGLVAYEFARAGASTIHGLERDAADVYFANRLFRDVPTESRFIQADLSISGPEFDRRYGQKLLPAYDMLLFLGVYHHLKRQAAPEALGSLIDVLLRRTRRRAVVRTKQIDEMEERLRTAGFARVGEEFPEVAGMGPLRIYERRG
ncbi:MAG: class I SAM-dependent methyltransferase [Myxococcota bacterium]